MSLVLHQELHLVPLVQPAYAETVQINLHSCCVTEDATTKEILPSFKKYYKEKFGKDVDVSASFAGSGTMKNRILGSEAVDDLPAPQGFMYDYFIILAPGIRPVCILFQVLRISEDAGERIVYRATPAGRRCRWPSFPPICTCDQLKEKGLIFSDGRKNPNNGAVIKSVIVFVTRKGNPKGLATFEDLARPGTKVLHASPDTSGGAQWAIFAIYGAGANFRNLLLDEPLSALDIKVRERLRREIAAVQKKVGITTLIVTHAQEEAMELGDRIAVMSDGRIEQVASPREVYQEPATEFVAKFIGEVNILPGQLYRGSAYAGNLAIRSPRPARGQRAGIFPVRLP